MMATERAIFDGVDVIANETKHLTLRREKLFGKEAAEKVEQNKFGIAVSGGGIRSATINLGFLKTLNLFNIIKKADYLSTVSGGGYTGSYIQATLKSKGSYNALFEKDRINHLRNYGNYFIPGQKGTTKRWNGFLVLIGYLGSLVMSLLSLGVVGGMIGVLYYLFGEMVDADSRAFLDNYAENRRIVYKYGLPALLTVVGLHFLANISMIFNLRVSKYFTKVEAALVFVAFLCFVGIFMVSFEEIQFLERKTYLTTAAIFLGLYLLGYFVNPNGISFHRFYRNQLAEAFLNDTEEYENVYLKELSNMEGEEKDYLAPYPLINTCLNIQSPDGDDKIKGAKASDYFLLSPLFCGSKLTKYVETKSFPGYEHMTLPAATTISAAAVNPGMGIYSNSLLSFIMTLFNARLGFWVNNPLKRKGDFWVWWPKYFFKELLADINTNLRKVNISDGGHIENLAVYELLRRRCRLIIAVDAGADPNFTFMDLENLAVRARNELGIDIKFREGQVPEQSIRPKPSSGYSERRFSIADLYHIWDEFELKDEEGIPVKVKGKRVEVLVNYTELDGQLKFRTDVKIKHSDVTADELYELQVLAAKQVQAELDKKKDVQGFEKVKFGTLVYVKSSVTAPKGKPYIPRRDNKGERNLQFDTYKYKIYHPDFPHESTADQFFDLVQWEAYFQLGQFIGKDVLDMQSKLFMKYQAENDSPKDISIDDLIACFDDGRNLFAPTLADILEAEEEEIIITDGRGLESATAKIQEEVPAIADESELDVGYEM
jgi:hypothetical protein